MSGGSVRSQKGVYLRFRQHIASQRPTGKRRKGSRPIHPRSRVGAGLSRFSGGRFSCLPSIQYKSSVAEELVDLGKSDTIVP
jgi:hypothetical protein